MKIILRLVAFAFVIGLLSLHVNAQTSSAAITGHVVDQSNAVVPNAEVKLVNQATGVVLTTHTNFSGDFIFPNMQPGAFTATVQAAGFKM
ncbi:MAG: carboxypeptidase-like regulatory domain-containing protein, partial [Formivibrio sp.]|nr:carboxypeptidase-like regulatory domain-containing protein [Formivibrio sp.]